MQIPYFKHIPTVKCTRCELRYLEKEAECPHCKNLSDSEVNALKLRVESEADAHSSLGKILLAVAAAILMITILLYLPW